MTKRDAIEAMARAIRKECTAYTMETPRKWDMAAEAAYNVLAEMAKAERKAQSTPSTRGPTA